MLVGGTGGPEQSLTLGGPALDGLESLHTHGLAGLDHRGRPLDDLFVGLLAGEGDLRLGL